MQGGAIPASYAALFKLMLTTGEAFTEFLRRMFEITGEPFEQHTARFEVDVYMAFRMSCSLQRNPRAWDDLSVLLMAGVVGTHRENVRSDSLEGVFEERVGTYGEYWNACVDSKKYPALKCLQMLRKYVHAAARRGRLDTRSLVDITDGFMAEMMATPALVGFDSECTGKLNCMLKHIMRLSDDIASLTENEVLLAAARGVDEANKILGHSSDAGSVQSQIRQAMATMQATAGSMPATRNRHWWKFWA